MTEMSRVAGRSRTVLWIAVALGLGLALFIGILATRRDAADIAADTPLIGKPAPDIGGTTLDAKTLRLSDLRGKFVVVNFFATWCVPCRLEHPELQRFLARHAVANDVAVVAVLFDDEPSAARAFIKKNGGDWPVITDADGKAALEFGVEGPPESFVLAPDGTVITRFVGQVTADGLDALLVKVKP